MTNEEILNSGVIDKEWSEYRRAVKLMNAARLDERRKLLAPIREALISLKMAAEAAFLSCQKSISILLPHPPLNKEQ